MIKCLFVDVKAIRSLIPRSEFDESKIEYLADLILASDGLLRPIILQEIGVEQDTGLKQYTVIEGHLEYYAAVRAKEKDFDRAETVNAFAIPDRARQSAIDQLMLISETRSNSISGLTNLNISIEQLTSIIAQQLQPLQQQLSNVVSELIEHKNILKSFELKRVETVDPPEIVYVDTLVDPKQTINPPQIDIVPKIEPVVELVKPKPKVRTPKIEADEKPEATKTPTKSKVAKSDKIEPMDQPIEPTITEVAPPAATKSTTAKKAKSASKSKVALDPSIDPIKVANTLDLINTLSEADLLVKMQKSGVPAGGIKLVSLIIDRRNLQPEQKFASWEVVMSEVAGLKSATAASIINKLK